MQIADRRYDHDIAVSGDKMTYFRGSFERYELQRPAKCKCDRPMLRALVRCSFGFANNKAINTGPMTDILDRGDDRATESPAPQLTPRVLFLCSGNYYRSRHAEIYFNWLAEQRGSRWRADSRGLALHENNVGPVSTHTALRVAELALGVDPHARFPRAVTEDDLGTADHIIAVKAAEHRPMVSNQFAHWLEAIEFWDIHDLDCALPQQALPLLERHVENLLERLSAEEAVDMRA